MGGAGCTGCCAGCQGLRKGKPAAVPAVFWCEAQYKALYWLSGQLLCCGTGTARYVWNAK